MLTDLLSSAAVDQAAEELYRRGQAGRLQHYAYRFALERRRGPSRGGIVPSGASRSTSTLCLPICSRAPPWTKPRRNCTVGGKPVDFNIMLTDLLSSAAVDQAAEELYRRGQAEIDSVEAIGRARRGDNVPHNVPANVAISDAPWPADSPPKNERPGSTKESEKEPPGAGVGLDE